MTEPSDPNLTVREWLLQAPEVVIFEFVTVVLPLTFWALMSLFMLLAVRGAFALVLWGGVWGVVSLWRIFVSFFAKSPAPWWSIGGLMAGTMAGLYYIVNGPLFFSIISLPSIGVAAHWAWLHRIRAACHVDSSSGNGP